MPEYRDRPNKDYLNERVRGTGGNPTSFGEENLLSLPLDRYDDESIGVHEFCHTIDGALRSIDPDWSDRRNAVYRNAIDKGLYKNAYAGSNAGEYWAEIGQAYFDCNRVNNWNHGPIGNREQLKVYDPEGYELCRTTFKLSPEQDWRYSFLQKLPNVTPPPEKFKIDPVLHEVHLGPRIPGDRPRGQRRGAAQGQRHDSQDVRLSARYSQGADYRRREAGGARPGRKPRRSAGIQGYRWQRPSVDLLSRTLDYSPDAKLLVVGEENVLGDPRDPTVGGNQVIRVFADAAVSRHRHAAGRPQLQQPRPQRAAVRAAGRADGRAVRRQAEGAVRKGDRRRQMEGHRGNPRSCRLLDHGVLAYFDAAGQEAAPNDADLPITTRERLKEYDPDLYGLVHETMAYGGHVDWRFEPARRKSFELTTRDVASYDELGGKSYVAASVLDCRLICLLVAWTCRLSAQPDRRTIAKLTTLGVAVRSEFDEGAIVSLRRRDDRVDTDYVNSGRRLGDVARALPPRDGDDWQRADTAELARSDDGRILPERRWPSIRATYTVSRDQSPAIQIKVGFVVDERDAALDDRPEKHDRPAAGDRRSGRAAADQLAVWSTRAGEPGPLEAQLHFGPRLVPVLDAFEQRRAASDAHACRTTPALSIGTPAIRHPPPTRNRPPMRARTGRTRPGAGAYFAPTSIRPPPAKWRKHKAAIGGSRTRSSRSRPRANRAMRRTTVSISLGRRPRRHSADPCRRRAESMFTSCPA